MSDSAFLAPRITPEIRDAAIDGAIYFQDEASQAVAELVNLEPGDRFLDVCAAPGGKTSLIAARHPHSQLIVAGDIYHSRVRLIDSICRGQGVDEVKLVTYDAENALPFPDESFDHVLVDAPCSGTGTFRSNPEIRYFLKPDDIAAFQRKQLAILRNASKLVAPGGSLVYSTCSLEIEENEEVIASFLSEFGAFKILDDVSKSILKTVDGFMRTFPDRDDTDGFFAAVMQRKKMDH